MNQAITDVLEPPGSALSQLRTGADFHDGFDVGVAANAPSSLDFYLGVARRTPAWVDTPMAARYRAVSLWA